MWSVLVLVWAFQWTHCLGAHETGHVGCSTAWCKACEDDWKSWCTTNCIQGNSTCKDGGSNDGLAGDKDGNKDLDKTGGDGKGSCTPKHPMSVKTFNARKYVIHTPSVVYEPKGLAIVLIPIDDGYSEDMLKCTCETIASDTMSQGVVVVCPTALKAPPKAKKRQLADDENKTKEDTGSACWKGYHKFGTCVYDKGDDASDVDYLAALIAEINSQYKIPTGKVIMSGFSNGGMMAYRMYCEKSDIIQGFVIVGTAWMDPWVGYYDYGNEKVPDGTLGCKPKVKRPSYHLCGKSDVYCGDNAAMGPGYDSVTRWGAFSKDVLGCSGEKKKSSTKFNTLAPGPTTCWEYDKCEASAPINRMCSVSGMGHDGAPVGTLVNRAFTDFFPKTYPNSANDCTSTHVNFIAFGVSLFSVLLYVAF